MSYDPAQLASDAPRLNPATSVKISPRDRLIIKPLGEVTGSSPLAHIGLSLETGGEQRFVMMGWDGAAIIRLLAEADGSLRVMNLGWDGSNELRESVEISGEKKIVNYGKQSGGTVTAILTESGGQQAVQLYGKDSGGQLDPIRTNENQQLYYEVFEKIVVIAPVELTNADAIVVDGSTLFSASDIVELTITVYNFTASAATVTLYHDVSAGGSVGNNEYLMNAESLAAKTRITLPSICVLGDADIRGFTAALNTCNVRIKAKVISRT